MGNSHWVWWMVWWKGLQS